MQSEILNSFENMKTPISAIYISHKYFCQFQYIAATLLLFLAIFHYIFAYVLDDHIIARFTTIFDPGLEDSIPTALSTLNLLISTVLLFAIHQHSRGRDEPISIYWLSLCIIFLTLTIDEVAGLHNRFNGLQEFTGVLIPMVQTHSWVLYGAVFALLMFAFFVPFLRRLDRRTATLFLLSGLIFVTGAVGFEALQAWMLHTGIASTSTDLANSICRILEESFEMYGIAIFNCTLFAHIVNHKVSIIVLSRP